MKDFLAGRGKKKRKSLQTSVHARGELCVFRVYCYCARLAILLINHDTRQSREETFFRISIMTALCLCWLDL